MERLLDLSRGYLPVAMVVAMLIAVGSGSYFLSAMASGISQNKGEIVSIKETVKVLPEMSTDIALIKRELGIEKDPKPTALMPYKDVSN